MHASPLALDVALDARPTGTPTRYLPANSLPNQEERTEDAGSLKGCSRLLVAFQPTRVQVFLYRIHLYLKTQPVSCFKINSQSFIPGYLSSIYLDSYALVMLSSIKGICVHRNRVRCKTSYDQFHGQNFIKQVRSSARPITVRPGYSIPAPALTAL